MAQPTFDEKLQEIENTMHALSNIADPRDPASAQDAAMPVIAQLCWLLASAYPQEVRDRVNKIVGDLNKIANA